MQEEWKKIYSSIDSFKVESLKNLLESHSIPAVVINKQDSMYVQLGELELYTQQSHLIKAMHLIQKTDL